MHCGQVYKHTKRRGKARNCDWCGQRIEVGELYETWLFFDGGNRSSCYAHEECYLDWANLAIEEGDMVDSYGDHERPSKAILTH